MRVKIAMMAAALAIACPAWAKKDCEALKAEIEAKLKAKGVAKYSLTIVGKDEVKGAKEVGSCHGGARRIVYKRG